MVLGTSVALGEHETHWRSFLQSLADRGLCGVELVISDAHEGLKAARRAVFGGVPWQRCQFHLQQNAQAYVPRQSMKAEVAADIHAIFNAATRHGAEALLATMVKKYEERASRLATWMEESIPEGLTVFSSPMSHGRRIRTANSLERLNREVRRRSRVAVLFPNTASCERLATAVLMEISEEWETSRTYMRMDAEEGQF